LHRLLLASEYDCNKCPPKHKDIDDPNSNGEDIEVIGSLGIKVSPFIVTNTPGKVHL
jgi:hypothetical protein